MFLLSLMVLLIFPCSSFAQEHYLLLSFSEPMDTSILKVKSHYFVFDSEMNPIAVNRIALIFSPDSSKCLDSLVIVSVPALSYKTNFILRVDSLTDKAGNLIDPENNSAWFYFDGFDPEADQPKFLINR